VAAVAVAAVALVVERLTVALVPPHQQASRGLVRA
jgi:hypothetical protein